ncbi:hypothetical protein K9L16_01210 [Candidatus Pacearchaeota archaeon]|nr:hypothetical protein [Candidatus Pacearchaeota archaeon]
MTNSRIIWGWAIFALGFLLVVIPPFFGRVGLIAWVYGIPLLVIGIVILLNKKEDVIETRKDLN